MPCNLPFATSDDEILLNGRNCSSLGYIYGSVCIAFNCKVSMSVTSRITRPHPSPITLCHTSSWSVTLCYGQPVVPALNISVLTIPPSIKLARGIQGEATSRLAHQDEQKAESFSERSSGLEGL